jgi:transposase InsO family protein
MGQGEIFGSDWTRQEHGITLKARQEQLAGLGRQRIDATRCIFDRAANFGDEVVCTIKAFDIKPKRTSFRSPWQNGVAERFVGSYRRDLLDHVIVLSEPHLKRLMADYIHYYHDDRTHLGLAKQTPAATTTEPSPRKQRGPLERLKFPTGVCMGVARTKEQS